MWSCEDGLHSPIMCYWCLVAYADDIAPSCINPRGWNSPTLDETAYYNMHTTYMTPLITFLPDLLLSQVWTCSGQIYEACLLLKTKVKILFCFQLKKQHLATCPHQEFEWGRWHKLHAVISTEQYHGRDRPSELPSFVVHNNHYSYGHFSHFSQGWKALDFMVWELLTSVYSKQD